MSYKLAFLNRAGTNQHVKERQQTSTVLVIPEPFQTKGYSGACFAKKVQIVIILVLFTWDSGQDTRSSFYYDSLVMKTGERKCWKFDSNLTARISALQRKIIIFW